MSKRSSDRVDGSPVFLGSFLNRTWVECPRCRSCAIVDAPDPQRLEPRITCRACSYVQEGWAPPDDAFVERCKQARCPRCNEWLGGAKAHYRASSDELDVLCSCGAIRTTSLSRRWLVGAPVDPYFRFALWLQTAVGDENLWAYNRDQLAFMSAYFSGTLRTRMPNHNRSLVSRLPAWMKSAKKQTAVLKGLARLERRADEAARMLGER